MLLKEHSNYEDGSKILNESLNLNHSTNTTNLNNININKRGDNMANAQVKETTTTMTTESSNSNSYGNFHFKAKKDNAVSTKNSNNKTFRKKVVQLNKTFGAQSESILNDQNLVKSHLNLVDSEMDYPSHEEHIHYEQVETKKEIKATATISTSKNAKQETKEALNQSINAARTGGLFVKYVSIGTAKIYTSFLMTMLSSIFFMIQNISPILQGTFNLALPALATWILSTKIPHVVVMMNTLAPQVKLLSYASFYFGSFFAWVTACLILTNLINGIGLGMKKLAQIGAQTK